MTTTRPRSRARRRGIQAVLALVATSMLLAAPQASGQEADAGSGGLGGYQGTAAASGLKAYYFLQGPLPVGPLVDLGVPDAYTTISTGPATFARASVADPGDVIANPNALLGSLDPNAPRVPEYPLRISATSGFGEPEVRSAPALGLDARVKVTPNSSLAEGSTPKFEAPAIVELGSLRSKATTETDGSTVTVRARTELGSFDLLGLVKIESIVSDVTATSDGTTTTTEGGTTIVGASVAGQPVIIDAEGIHADPKAKKKNPLFGALTDFLGLGTGKALDPLQLLETAGIEITLAGPQELEASDAAQLAVSGLRIDVSVTKDTVPLLHDLLDALPPIENPIPGLPGVEDVFAILKANHFVALEVGGASVSLEARAAFVPEPFESAPIETPATTPAPPASTGSVSTPTPTQNAPSVPAAPTVTTPTAPVADTTDPTGALSAGIGALALIALLLQPFLGDRVARGATAVLGSGQPDTCLREGQ